MNKIAIKAKDTDVKKLEKALGVTLIAKKANSTVNGHVNYIQDGGKIVAEIVLYNKDEDPTFELYEKDGVTYSRGRKTTIKKSDDGLSKVREAEINGMI